MFLNVFYQFIKKSKFMNIKNPMLDEIISEWLKNPNISKQDFHKLKNKIYKKFKIDKPVQSIEILNRYIELIREWKQKENSIVQKTTP